MTIPDYQTIMLPLLKLAEDDQEHSFQEAVENLVNHFNLTEEQLRELLPSGQQAIFRNRIGWARSYMKQAGLLEATRRGYFRITQRGLSVLQQNPDNLDVNFLNQFEELQDFRKRSKTKPVEQKESEEQEQGTPEEAQETAYENLRNELANDLLQQVKKSPPLLFERTVVEVLVKMGYGGSLRDAGKAIGRSGDEGIDGIIVEWIDGLIGKVGSLAVDKLVAVSKKGFVETAVKKARAHGIDTLTVEEAVEKDWETYPMKPGILVFSHENYKLHDVLFNDGKQYRTLRDLGLDSVVFKDGKEVGLIKETFEYFFQKFLLPKIQEKVKSEFLSIFKTKTDLSKILYVESNHTFTGFTVRLFSGDKIDISKLKFIVHGTRRFDEVDQKHIKFNEMMVSTGEYVDTDSSVLYKI